MKFALPTSQFLTTGKFKSFLSFSGKNNYLIHLIVCLNLAITVPLAAILNIWTDEAYALDTVSENLSYAITQAINFELQPPFYFILLKHLGVLGEISIFSDSRKTQSYAPRNLGLQYLIHSKNFMYSKFFTDVYM